MNRTVIIILITLFITSCATPKSIILKEYNSSEKDKLEVLFIKNEKVSIPNKYLELMDSNLKKGLSKKFLLASNSENPNHIVRIEIKEFNMRDDAERLIAGILAGCDVIDSDIVIIEKSTNEIKGKSNISIKECAAWGVASQVIEKYTDSIVSYIAK